MRSEKVIMTSRLEFLSNALGIGLVTAGPWPVRAAQVRSKHGQSDRSASKSRRTTQKGSLRWDVFLAHSIREHAMFAVRVKSIALLFEPLDTSGSKAGTQSAHRPDGVDAGQ